MEATRGWARAWILVAMSLPGIGFFPTTLLGQHAIRNTANILPATYAAPPSARPVTGQARFVGSSYKIDATPLAGNAPDGTSAAAGHFQGPDYLTRNFHVRAGNAQLAKHVGDAAEKYRRELAEMWLGRELPPWSQPCPIQVVITHQAEGETSFLLPEFGEGMPTDWSMTIKGPVDRLVDSVLPHEITHTIMATHFKQRLPRWVDEGACTTVEHPSEKQKIHRMLMDFLSPRQRKGLPFNRMFVMREYPRDLLPLYAQGYSVSRYLIAQGGHQHFTQFIQSGLQNEKSAPGIPAWTKAVQDYYQYEDLSELQVQWLDWVQKGSQESVARQRLEQPDAIAMQQVPPSTATEQPMERVALRGTEDSVSNRTQPGYYQRLMKENTTETQPGSQQTRPQAGVPAQPVNGFRPTTDRRVLPNETLDQIPGRDSSEAGPAERGVPADYAPAPGDSLQRQDSTILMPIRKYR